MYISIYARYTYSATQMLCVLYLQICMHVHKVFCKHFKVKYISVLMWQWKKKGFVQLSKSRCVKQTCNYHLRSNTMSLIGMHKIFGLHYIWTIWYDDHTLSGPSLETQWEKSRGIFLYFLCNAYISNSFSNWTSICLPHLRLQSLCLHAHIVHSP